MNINEDMIMDMVNKEISSQVQKYIKSVAFNNLVKSQIKETVKDWYNINTIAENIIKNNKDIMDAIVGTMASKLHDNIVYNLKYESDEYDSNY